MLWTVEESDLTALLEADGSASAAHCVDALRLGAKVEPVRESTDLDQHIFWLDKHRHALSELNDEAALERFMEFLRDPSTRSVTLTSVGLRDEALLPDSYFTLVVNSTQNQLICCLVHRRESPRRV